MKDCRTSSPFVRGLGYAVMVVAVASAARVANELLALFLFLFCSFVVVAAIGRSWWHRRF